MTGQKVAAVHISLEGGGQDIIVGQELRKGERIGAISALRNVNPPSWAIHSQNGAVLAVLSAGSRPYMVEYETKREPVGPIVPPDPADID